MKQEQPLCKSCEKTIDATSFYCPYCGKDTSFNVEIITEKNPVVSIKYPVHIIGGYYLAITVLFILHDKFIEYSQQNPLHKILLFLNLGIYFLFAYFSKGRIRLLFLVSGFIMVIRNIYYTFLI